MRVVGPGGSFKLSTGRGSSNHDEPWKAGVLAIDGSFPCACAEYGGCHVLSSPGVNSRGRSRLVPGESKVNMFGGMLIVSVVGRGVS